MGGEARDEVVAEPAVVQDASWMLGGHDERDIALRQIGPGVLVDAQQRRHSRARSNQHERTGGGRVPRERTERSPKLERVPRSQRPQPWRDLAGRDELHAELEVRGARRGGDHGVLARQVMARQPDLVVLPRAMRLDPVGAQLDGHHVLGRPPDRKHLGAPPGEPVHARTSTVSPTRTVLEPPSGTPRWPNSTPRAVIR